MIYTIKTFPTTKFIGKSQIFSYDDYRIFELWKNFMPSRNEIQNKISSDFYNIQINPDNFDFNPTTKFIKWAAVPVYNFEVVPVGLEKLEIKEGLYMVFKYKGNQSNASEFYRKIFTEWIPNSEYELDNRAQFEILGENYKKDSAESEEEIWMPIKKK